MKYLLILSCLLFTSVGWSKEVSIYDLEERDGLYYEKFKDISFSGEAVVYYKNSKLSEKFNYKNGNFLKKYATLTKFPGYADRIFYNKLKPVRNSYQTIHVVGSDHMPVTMTFN